eukprot:CAMPEP_0202902182 /NCGR_PEP_ID=MMETSP1392-20130828/16708_1 /ASSEMBLY_ACC=CAM_ASM_000868 /TAXON_ID=225041 /ORGANISM="Chlamydomonas chlamydogama, Strain SAG 11-48b" /LENGTH=70 /DNA_ID=CAMNT_0049588911 /DNA_START=464 /DNA_END=676 /DNA_ORIENTATION=-
MRDVDPATAPSHVWLLEGLRSAEHQASADPNLNSSSPGLVFQIMIMNQACCRAAQGAVLVLTVEYGHLPL